MLNYKLKSPFQASGGKRNAKVAIVGEAWGANEKLLSYPLVGWSGLELARMLRQADLATEPPNVRFGQPNGMMQHWWSFQSIFTTNVFAFQPSGDNKIEAICAKKAECEEESQRLFGKTYTTPLLGSGGKYVLPRYLGEIDRLKAELEEVRPNLVIAIGGTALWALCGSSAISKLRGAIQESTLVPGLKVLPTYHPASVMRNWSQRPIVVADLIKAKGEIDFPQIVRPERQVLVNPTIEEVENYVSALLDNPPPIIGLDIETKFSQVEMLSVARNPHCAIAIPFLDTSKMSWSYWPSVEQELRAWQAVQRVLASPIPKCWQNGAAFDLIRLGRIGLKIRANQDDTMLLSHAKYPEMPKALGFLGSIYTNEAPWKLMRLGNKVDELKREE